MKCEWFKARKAHWDRKLGVLLSRYEERSSRPNKTVIVFTIFMWWFVIGVSVRVNKRRRGKG